MYEKGIPIGYILQIQINDQSWRNMTNIIDDRQTAILMAHGFREANVPIRLLVLHGTQVAIPQPVKVQSDE